MSKTEGNLKLAFAGESQAFMRYTAFAEKADAEGLPDVARLFRAAARAEMVHALSHLSVLGQVGDTPANLQQAIEGETEEFKKMYPAMIKDAVAEKETDARHSFEYAMSVEMIHAKLYKKALEDPQAAPDSSYWICPLCGNTVAGAPPKKCPFCGVDESQFIEVE